MPVSYCFLCCKKLILMLQPLFFYIATDRLKGNLLWTILMLLINSVCSQIIQGIQTAVLRFCSYLFKKNAIAEPADHSIVLWAGPVISSRPAKWDGPNQSWPCRVRPRLVVQWSKAQSRTRIDHESRRAPPQKKRKRISQSRSPLSS